MASKFRTISGECIHSETSYVDGKPVTTYCPQGVTLARHGWLCDTHYINLGGVSKVPPPPKSVSDRDLEVSMGIILHDAREMAEGSGVHLFPKSYYNLNLDSSSDDEVDLEDYEY